MGLKLKWFRRRITFEGIPSAPERSIRRKEQNSDITTIGVYRKSVNFEDYIEPSRASYWEPPISPIATSTIRKQNTSTNSSTTFNNSSSSAKYSAGDKIVSNEHNNGGIIETPPEPPYSPPKPPSRRGLSKANSTPNVLVLESVNPDSSKTRSIEATRSVEVLTEVRDDKQLIPIVPAPRTASINYIMEDDNKKEKDDETWKQQQPEFFNEILEKVNVLANTAKPITTDYGEDSESDSSEDVFEKVKPKPRLLTEKVPSTPQSIEKDSTVRDYSRNHSSSSIEDIFEPRPPEVLGSEEQLKQTKPLQKEDIHKPTEPEPISEVNHMDNVATPPLKSILKKRAPLPPQPKASAAESTVTPSEIPTPPPRAIRKQPSPPAKNNDEDEDDDDDDYLNWNMVERHRSSITHTVATQKVDPDIMRNVPSSLQQTSASHGKHLLNKRALLDDDSPKTLRGMRNNRLKTDDNTFLGLQGRSARDSESNFSEASA